MRSQLIGQNCPNNEGIEKKSKNKKQKQKKTGEGDLELDGTVRNQMVAINIGR